MSWFARFEAPAFDDPEADLGHAPPTGHVGPVPPGLGLTGRLVEILRSGGVAVENRWATDYSHAFDVRVGSDRFDVMVHPPAGEARRWAVSLEQRRGLLQRVTGRPQDTPSLRNLCRSVHDALAALPGVAELRWFDDEAWHGVDTEGGARKPPPAP